MVFGFSSALEERDIEYHPILQRPNTPTPRSPSPERYPAVPQTATPPTSDEEAEPETVQGNVGDDQEFTVVGDTCLLRSNACRQLFVERPLEAHTKEAEWGTFMPIHRQRPTNGAIEQEINCPRALRANSRDGQLPPVIMAPIAMELLTGNHETPAEHWSSNKHIHSDSNGVKASSRDDVICIHGRSLCKHCGDAKAVVTPRRPITWMYQEIVEHNPVTRNRNSRTRQIDMRGPAPSFRKRLRFTPDSLL